MDKWYRYTKKGKRYIPKGLFNNVLRQIQAGEMLPEGEREAFIEDALAFALMWAKKRLLKTGDLTPYASDIVRAAATVQTHIDKGAGSDREIDRLVRQNCVTMHFYLVTAARRSQEAKR